MMIKRLDELVPQQNARIKKVHGFGALRQRMLDMGLVPGAEISVIRVAPMGDPIEYRIKGYHLSLRGHEAQNILVEVNSIALGKAKAGEFVRLVSFITGKQASKKLLQLGLSIEETFEILKNGPAGKILLKNNERLIEIGQGLAARVLVEILPSAEAV